MNAQCITCREGIVDEWLGEREVGGLRPSSQPIRFAAKVLNIEWHETSEGIETRENSITHSNPFDAPVYLSRNLFSLVSNWIVRTDSTISIDICKHPSRPPFPVIPRFSWLIFSSLRHNSTCFMVKNLSRMMRIILRLKNIYFDLLNEPVQLRCSWWG